MVHRAVAVSTKRVVYTTRPNRSQFSSVRHFYTAPEYRISARLQFYTLLSAPQPLTHHHPMDNSIHKVTFSRQILRKNLWLLIENIRTFLKTDSAVDIHNDKKRIRGKKMQNLLSMIFYFLLFNK